MLSRKRDTSKTTTELLKALTTFAATSVKTKKKPSLKDGFQSKI